MSNAQRINRVGRPTVEDCLTIKLNDLFAKGLLIKGAKGRDCPVSWSRGGSCLKDARFSFDMTNSEDAWLDIQHSGRAGPCLQRIRLVVTRPNYGGRRWWMMCPLSGRPATKLHLPPGGDFFASQSALRLGYRSQRLSRHVRPMERLFRLQQAVNRSGFWDSGLRHPKGMWHRTFHRRKAKYYQAAGLIAAAASGSAGLLPTLKLDVSGWADAASGNPN